MTHRAPPAVPGFDRAETFANSVRFGDFIRRLIPMLGMLFVVVALMIALLLTVAQVGALVLWPVALLVAAGVCGLMLIFKKRQFDAVWGHARLELGPYGAVLREPRLTIELPWSQVRQIGPVDLMTALRVGGNRPLTAALRNAAEDSARRPSEGLIGVGTLTLTPQAGRLLRAQVAQNHGSSSSDDQVQGVHGIVLGHYDPHWRHGRIGAWIRAYRPDLLA